MSPDVFDGIFPRITGVFSHLYMRNKTHVNSVRKKEILAISCEKAMAIQEFPIQKKNVELSEED